MTFETLRLKHPSFCYEKWESELHENTLYVSFTYTLEPDIHFVTKVAFHGINAEKYALLDKNILENLFLHLGMIEGFSYWKSACPKHFRIRAGFFSPEQLKFWRELLQKGLSEFYFINNIDGWSNDFASFSIETPEKVYSRDDVEHDDEIIIPVGGGKDSVVTLEMMKETSKKISTLTVNPTKSILSVLEVSEIQKKYEVTRILDPKLIELNSSGYLNGHTPFSAMLSFVSITTAYIFDKKYIALSNEWSANEGNVVFLGQKINHQYSKTLEYEANFRKYCQMYLSSTIEYFSLLRPLHELQIAEIFTHSPQYFSSFLSCNRGQKNGEWCGECAKCLFVFCMLSPFLPIETLLQIFHQNLFEKESLRPILDELSGVVEAKSLECVGTRDETRVALYLTLLKYEGSPLPVLLTYAKKSILNKQTNYQRAAYDLLHSYQTHHFIPPELEKLFRYV